MRILKIVVAAWVLVFAGILIVPRIIDHTQKPSTNSSVPVGSQVIGIIEDVGHQHDGPVEGQSSGKREKLQDVAQIFLQLINQGKLDDAGTMIDGNYMLDLMAKDRPADQGKYIRDYVHLFEPGEMLKAKVSEPKEISRNMSCKVEIQLNSGVTLNFNFGVVEMSNEHDQEKLWYFSKIERVKN